MFICCPLMFIWGLILFLIVVFKAARTIFFVSVFHRCFSNAYIKIIKPHQKIKLFLRTRSRGGDPAWFFRTTQLLAFQSRPLHDIMNVLCSLCFKLCSTFNIFASLRERSGRCIAAREAQPCKIMCLPYEVYVTLLLVYVFFYREL